MSLKRRKAGLGFTSWQRSFSILAPWRKGKGDMVLDGEVVLTKMKTFKNFSEKLLVSEDSFSTTSSSVSVCEQEASTPARPSGEEDPRLREVPRSPSTEEAASSYLRAMFSNSQLPRLYKFESEDSGVELPSGANSPSTPTGSEQSFVVHSRESSCDSRRLSPSAPVPDEVVSSSEAGGSGEEHTTSLTTDADGNDAGDDVDDTLLKSTMTEEEFGFSVEPTDKTAVEGGAEACCGDVFEISTDSLVQVAGSEPCAEVEEEEVEEEEAVVEEEEEEEGLSEQTSVELRPCGEEEDVFCSMPSAVRKSSMSDSLEEYMDECCRISEIQEATSNTPMSSGLGYLEHICRLMEKIGQLQETNIRLQKQICGIQKTTRVAKTREDFFQHHCSCGAAGLAYQEPPKRLQRNDLLSLSGTLSDLSTIHEVIRRPPLSEGNGRALGPVPLWRRGQNRRSYTEGETRFLRDAGAEGGPPVTQRRLSENHTWGRVKDLVRRTKLRTSSTSRLGLSPTSLKMSCPQLYRPDLGPVEPPRSRNRNSMISLGQQNQLDLSWLE